MFEFKLPDLGEGVHEGQVVSVHVKEGQPIKEFDPMMEVETDKAAVEIPSPRTGTVSKIMVQPGQMVKVGQVMLAIDDGVAAAAKPADQQPPAPQKRGEPAPAAKAPPQAAPARAPSVPSRPAPAPAGSSAPAPRATPSQPPRPMPAPQHTSQPAVRSIAATAASSGPIAAAPAVRKLAREMGVDLAQIQPSGPHGRVIREDVERAASGGGAQFGEHPFPGPNGNGAPGVMQLPAEALPDFSHYGPVRRERVSQIRRTIARQMTRAWLNVPRVTHGDEVDITELERNRKELNKNLREGQPKITMTAIVLKAVAAALREYPKFNCSYDAGAEEIIFKDYIHIGVAVDSPRGLVVPVVRDVDRKPLPQVAAELTDVADRVREGKFEVNELRGATFTVTNVGALGGTVSTPMVNFPEVAIFGTGKAKWTPVVLEDQKTIAPRLMMPVFLSFDHRMCDGADAARFTREIVSSLQNPLRLISFG